MSYRRTTELAVIRAFAPCSGMTWWQVITLAGAFVGTAGVVATLILRTTARLDERIDGVHEEATADRRAFQQAMDLFRTEMQRLAERQAWMEGWTERRAEAD